MPPTVAPAAVPVMPPNFPAHSQTATTAADDDFAAVLRKQIPQSQMSGRKTNTAKNPSSDKVAKAVPEKQDLSAQAGTDPASTAAKDDEAGLAQTLAANPRLAAFLAGLGQQTAADSANGTADAFTGFDSDTFTGLDPAALKLALNLAAANGHNGQAGQTMEAAKQEASFLEKLLPQLTESKSIASQPFPVQATSQEGITISDLRQLVASHDSQARVSFARGEQASLNDIRPLAVSEESGAQTVDMSQTVAAKAVTSGIGATADTASELLAATAPDPVTAKSANALAKPATVLTDKTSGGQGARQITPEQADSIVGATAEKRESDQSERNTPSGQTAQAFNSDQGTAGEKTPDFSQTIATTAAALPTTATVTTATGGIIQPSQSFLSGTAVMQQMIDHIRDLPRPLPNRISLQLHPAELGELKINLTMKEGIIRASIVTQTVQAQEILEKQMPKLRGLLAGQDLILDDVRINQEALPVTDPAFFDNRQSPRQGHENDTAGKGAATYGEEDDSSFAQALEQAGQENRRNRPGVNIQA